MSPRRKTDRRGRRVEISDRDLAERMERAYSADRFGEETTRNPVATLNNVVEFQGGLWICTGLMHAPLVGPDKGPNEIYLQRVHRRIEWKGITLTCSERKKLQPFGYDRIRFQHKKLDYVIGEEKLRIIDLSESPSGQFDAMIVGEIAEAHNQSMDWFYSLPSGKRHYLYEKQLASPPRKKT